MSYSGKEIKMSYSSKDGGPPKKKLKLEVAPPLSTHTLRENVNAQDESMLCVKNPHKLDSQIKFQEEGHIYWINEDKKDLVSSTTFVHKYFEGFNANMIVQRILSSKKINTDPDYKYYKMNKQQILDSWAKNGKEAREKGTHMHLQIELYLNKQPHDPNTHEFNLFKKFEEEHKHLEPYRTEMMVFDEPLRITGSLDMVYRDTRNGSFVLADWKRSKEIKKKGFKKGKGILNHVSDCNFYHYSLQLSLYKYIFEKNYGMNISESFLIVLHPDNKEYIKIPTKDMYREICFMLEDRRCHLIDLGYKDLKDLNVDFKNIVF